MPDGPAANKSLDGLAAHMAAKTVALDARRIALEAEVTEVREQLDRARSALAEIEEFIAAVPEAEGSKSATSRLPLKEPRDVRPGIARPNESGLTRRQVALQVLATAESPVSSRDVAEVFANGAPVDRSAVEGARSTLVKLVKDGYATRFGQKHFIAMRRPATLTVVPAPRAEDQIVEPVA